MSFSRQTKRTARKEHKCWLCGKTIVKGEKYLDLAWMWDGEFGHESECMECKPAKLEFSNSYYADEGYGPDVMAEWWQTEKCMGCKYYLENGDCEKSDMTHYMRCENFEKEETK